MRLLTAAVAGALLVACAARGTQYVPGREVGPLRPIEHRGVCRYISPYAGELAAVGSTHDDLAASCAANRPAVEYACQRTGGFDEFDRQVVLCTGGQG